MYFQCLPKYGVNSVTSYTELPSPELVLPGGFQTGDIDFPVELRRIKNICFVGEAVDGATGTLEVDYKRRKAVAINGRTDAIIAEGFVHNGHRFRLREEDQRNAMGLLLQHVSGFNLTGQFFRAVGSSYYFANNADFLAWYRAGATVIQMATATGSALKDQLSNVENSVAGINSIVDNR